MTLLTGAVSGAPPTSRIVMDGPAWVVVRDLLRVIPFPAPFEQVQDPSVLPGDVREAAVTRLWQAGVLRSVAPPRLVATIQRALLLHTAPAARLELDLRHGDEVVVARLAMLQQAVSGLVWQATVTGTEPALPVRDVGTVTLLTTTADRVLDDLLFLIPAPNVTPSADEVGRGRLLAAIEAHGHASNAFPGTLTATVRVPGMPAGEIRWLHDGDGWWEAVPAPDGSVALHPAGRDRLRDLLVRGLARRIGAAAQVAS